MAEALNGAYSTAFIRKKNARIRAVELRILKHRMLQHIKREHKTIDH